jgi:hypothetical protein
MKKSLSNEERRQIILEALQPNANLSKMAREHGTHRNTIYDYFPTCSTTPKEECMTPRRRPLSGARFGS